MNEAGVNVKKKKFSLFQKLLLLLINYIPLCHIAMIVFVLVFPSGGAFVDLKYRIIMALFFLYLLPPLCVRLLLLLFPIRNTEMDWGSRDAFIWWLIYSLQINFTRFFFLEEFLRIIPGSYSMWLRLWGAKIGRLTYWAPGVAILDRSFLKVGDNVIFGSGVRVNPHVFTRDDLGRSTLVLDFITVEDDVIVGGYCLLTSGTKIVHGETVRATTILPPYSVYKDGCRHRFKKP